MSVPVSSRAVRAAGHAPWPRIGYLGAGWIGRRRMQALVATGTVESVAVADPDADARAAAAAAVPGIATAVDLDALLALDLDGVVIATPSALHAEQAMSALEHGLAVFCQKPVARNGGEVVRLLRAARAADRLLAADLSYRHTRAVEAARELLRSGALGEVYAAELTFHNAYGPDQPWFSRRSLSGGGALIDLGTHLVDLALWLTGSRSAIVRWADVRRRGAPLASAGEEVEDFAAAQLTLETGASVRIACSWWMHAGRDCVFECAFHGSEGGVTVSNVDGSFYDFRTARHRGTRSEVLVEGPDDWGGRAITAWADRLSRSARFDPAAGELEPLARILDDAYAWAACGS